MAFAAAALDARGRQRITAAAAAAALQAVFYCLILREVVEPTVPAGSTPLEITILRTAGRLRPVTLRRKSRLEGPGRLAAPREVPPPAGLIEPITPPRTPGPGHAPVDWQQAMQGEVRAEESLSRKRKLHFGFPHAPPAGPAAPSDFGWDYAHTHRVEALPEGGLLINVTDRCALVVYVLLIPVCKIGRMPADGRLFDHMQERRDEQRGALP